MTPPIPREGNYDGAASDAQWAAAHRWSARYRRQHRHEDPCKRFDRAEEEDERYRDRRN